MQGRGRASKEVINVRGQRRDVPRDVLDEAVNRLRLAVQGYTFGLQARLGSVRASHCQTQPVHRLV